MRPTVLRAGEHSDYGMLTYFTPRRCPGRPAGPPSGRRRRFSPRLDKRFSTRRCLRRQTPRPAGAVEALYLGSLTVEEHRRARGEREAFVVQSGRTDAVGSGAKRERKQIPKSEFVYEEGADICGCPQRGRVVALGRFHGNETVVR